MNELEVLRAARKLIERPEDWSCRGWGHSGRHCLGHAIASVLGTHDHPDYERLRVMVECEGRVEEGSLYRFNDSHTHAEVLALLDDVIAKLEEQEPGSPLPPIPQTLHPSEPSKVLS